MRVTRLHATKVGSSPYWARRTHEGHVPSCVMAFQPGGAGIACAVILDQRHANGCREAVWDAGRIASAFDHVHCLVYAEDGRELSYLGVEDRRCYVVRGAERLGPVTLGEHDYLFDLRHRLGSRQLVCRGSRGRLYVDGKEVASALAGGYTFHPTTHELVYVTQERDGPATLHVGSRTAPIGPARVFGPVVCLADRAYVIHWTQDKIYRRAVLLPK